MADKADTNRFEDFFGARDYTVLKNHLYNYRLRKRAIEKMFRKEPPGLILEIGSGISPVMTTSDSIVYSELSFNAIKMLKSVRKTGWYVTADTMRLPFKSCVFSHAVSSEVLEHLEDDHAALKEIARVLKPSGTLFLTFPHRKAYFTNDDRFVRHYRRYELAEMIELLNKTGFEPLYVEKVLGPLEKITMLLFVFIYSFIHKGKKETTSSGRNLLFMKLFSYSFNLCNQVYMGLSGLMQG